MKTVTFASGVTVPALGAGHLEYGRGRHALR